MRGAGGALAVAVAALLVCCSADPHQESEVSGNEHNSGDRYDAGLHQKQDLEDFLRFLYLYESSVDNHNLNGIGGNLVGRNLNDLGGTGMLGRNLDAFEEYYSSEGKSAGGGGLGGSSMLGRNLPGFGGYELRNLHGVGGSGIPGRSLESTYGYHRNGNGAGSSTLLGNKRKYSRYLDSLGGSNFVRNLDSIGGANLVRNLDSIGGANLVKKNLDQLGGPNLVKKTLDSLGGANFVRNLDSLGGGNFVRHKPRNLDPLGGGNLVREVREVRDSRHFVPYLLSRRYDYASPYGGGGKREFWPLAPVQYGGYYSDGLPKRNFDEIDRSGLDNFVKKRNFDEIDQTSMPFPYATKRFYHFGPNYLDIDSPASSFDKKRYRLDFPMDEIDLSHFPIGSKRSQDSFRPVR